MFPYTKAVAERFWAKVKTGAGCWEWQAALRNGYGAFRIGGVGSKVEQAHRVAWVLQHGPIPSGMMVLHKCDNRRCVRHLYLGDHAQNMQDMCDRTVCRGDNHWSRKYPNKVRRGIAHHGAKLDPQQVESLRVTYAAGVHSQRDLAALYGIGQAQVSRIVTGKRWAEGG